MGISSMGSGRTEGGQILDIRSIAGEVCIEDNVKTQTHARYATQRRAWRDTGGTRPPPSPAAAAGSERNRPRRWTTDAPRAAQTKEDFRDLLALISTSISPNHFRKRFCERRAHQCTWDYGFMKQSCLVPVGCWRQPPPPNQPPQTITPQMINNNK